MHAPAFVVLGTWALVLMFRDYSRELGLVGLSGLRLVRLPFGMAVHVRVASAHYASLSGLSVSLTARVLSVEPTGFQFQPAASNKL